MVEGIDSLGARWTQAIADLPPEGVALDVALEGARVRVACGASRGDAGPLETRVTAAAPGFDALRLRAFEESPLWSLGKVLGAQDITTGSDDFDRRYVVQANDVAFARLALNDGVCSALAAMDPAAERAGYALDVDRGVIALTRVGVEHDLLRLGLAVRAAAALSRRGAEIFAELGTLAAELGGELPAHCTGWAPDGGAPIVVRRGEPTARVEHVFGTLGGVGPRLWTRVSVARRCALRDAVVMHRRALKLDRHRVVVPALLEHWDARSAKRHEYVLLTEDRELEADRLAWLDDLEASLSWPDALVLDRDSVAAWYDGFIGLDEGGAERLRHAIDVVRRLLASERATAARLLAARAEVASAPMTPWLEAARALGGTFVPSVGERPEMILAELDGVLVKASASREGSATVTRITAPTSGTGGLSFTVLEAGTGPDDLDLRQRDLYFEEPEFDRRFAVWSAAPHFALLWLTPEVRRFLVDAYDRDLATSYELEVAGEMITLKKGDLDGDEQRLARAMRLVAAYCRRGAEVLALWRELAGRLGGELDAGLLAHEPCWRPDGAAMITIAGVQPRLSLDHQATAPWLDGPGLFTRVRAVGMSSGPGRFAVCSPELSRHEVTRVAEHLGVGARLPDNVAEPWVVVAEEPEELARWLDDDLLATLDDVEPSAVIGLGAEVTIWLAGFVDDADLLRAAIELAASLCSDELRGGPAGPYR